MSQIKTIKIVLSEKLLYVILSLVALVLLAWVNGAFKSDFEKYMDNFKASMIQAEEDRKQYLIEEDNKKAEKVENDLAKLDDRGKQAYFIRLLGQKCEQIAYTFNPIKINLIEKYASKGFACAGTNQKYIVDSTKETFFSDSKFVQLRVIK